MLCTASEIDAGTRMLSCARNPILLFAIAPDPSCAAKADLYIDSVMRYGRILKISSAAPSWGDQPSGSEYRLPVSLYLERMYAITEHNFAGSQRTVLLYRLNLKTGFEEQL